MTNHTFVWTVLTEDDECGGDLVNSTPDMPYESVIAGEELMVRCGLEFPAGTGPLVTLNGLPTATSLYFSNITLILMQLCLHKRPTNPLVPHSTDLSPTEQLWNVLGRYIASKAPHPTKRQMLVQALKEELARIPQADISNLTQSMRSGCTACSPPNNEVSNTGITTSSRVIINHYIFLSL